MAAPTATNHDHQSVSPPAKRALILVVERNSAIQRLEKYFFEEAGYQVEFVSDGHSALERAQVIKPEIIVTEILVPKLDGLTLCRKLKENPETNNINVLIFSHLAAADRAKEAGAAAFFSKPIVAEQIVDVIEKLIGNHHQQRFGGND